MHSFAKVAVAVFLGACVLHAGAQTSDPKAAGPDTAATGGVRAVPELPVDAPVFRSIAAARYHSLLEQDVLVSNSPAAAADDLRVVVNNYWTFVRRYPTTGFADNALWQAATLSAEAFRRFNEDRDHHRSEQLLQWLSAQYPHSPLRDRAAAQIEPAEPKASAASVAETVVRAVHREILPEVVRVTLELDREVPFYQERIDGPARLFFDLKGTRTVPALVDSTFRYDSDVVRHIRLGRHPNNTTRVVLDLENVGRYSVFTLYNPYRIVIDAERAPGMRAALRDVETAGTSSSAPQPIIGATADRSASAASAPQSRQPVADTPPAIEELRRVRRFAPRAVVAVVPLASQSVPLHTSRAAAAKSTSAPLAPTVPSTPLPPSANGTGKFSVARQLGLGISKIVIDPGHGGHDPGASAFGISESELVLDVTLRLEKLLREQPGMEVVLTRRTNDFVSLEERTERANRESADLFLSIHANASANETARGVETYFLNFALNRQAEAVAARENAASEKTMSSLPDIIKAITLNSKLNESRDFASSVQRALIRGLRPGNKTVRDLGVKQAPFMVLIGASMPSVLAEISFVTNREESRLLKTPAYRQRIAESLLAGILRYQQSLKKSQGTLAQTSGTKD
jgi:N-acetylmuramoyl-L-alanine amidase